MRIAYIAPYQGPTLTKQRPIVANLSLAGSTKIELIATLLRACGHEVEVISQGEVVQLEWKYYPPLREAYQFDAEIPVFYSSALPIRRLNGWWSKYVTLRHFKSRHADRPFDIVVIYNMKTAQIGCAMYAIRRLGVPVVLEYEDDVFVDVDGAVEKTSWFRNARAEYKEVVDLISGGIAVSPHLLAQFPRGIPNLLLRGVIGEDIIRATQSPSCIKKNWVLFSGTHTKSKGIEPLIEAWTKLALPDWELHITGFGDLTNTLKQMSQEVEGIIFHGLVSRAQLVELLTSAKICINPHELSLTAGNVFAFKIIEYLAAGAHVVTTPMGHLERMLETGITYMTDNLPETIAATLSRVIRDNLYLSTATQSAHETYGPTAVSKSLDDLFVRITKATERA